MKKSGPGGPGGAFADAAASGAGAPAARGPDVSLESLTEAVEQVAALAKAGVAGSRLWEPLLGPDADEEDLAAWARRLERSPAGPFAAAIAAVHQVALKAGASTAVLLGSVTQALTDAQESADALAAAMAGPKASARLLQFLPLLGLVLGTAMGASPLPVLFGGGAGTAALVIGVVLLAAGKAWSSALIRSASRPVSTDPLAAAVLAAALRAGMVLPAALIEVGCAWPGRLGAAMRSAGRGLAAGRGWDAAWAAPGVGGVGVDAAAGEVGGRAGGAAGATAGGTVRVGLRAGRDGPSAGLAKPLGRPPPARMVSTDFAQALRRALRPAWESGAEAGPLLEGARARAARADRRRLAQGAARLGVHLMAPLGLCYLPAFVALGLAPVVISFAGVLLAGV
ncbi:MAG: hypothetical protein LBS27_03430 [Bifidobacteriaceae bacterium]|jgi:tight adherence protein B|nr:hypothetical protein [Bifidobacteriaceae bacterium]